MAQKCAICGDDINLVQQLKLRDGNFICRGKCKKLGFKTFDYQHMALDDVKAHFAQVEKGTKIWTELMAPDKAKRKSMKRIGSPVYVAENLGLMAFVETNYKFFLFGKTEKACVYRIADLFEYKLDKSTKIVDGKPQNDYVIQYSFSNTPGMADFDVKTTGDASYKSAKKYYDTLFGIQDTLGNFANKSKAQFEALKAAADVAKAMKDGGDVDSSAENAAAALTKVLKGDRQKWIDLASKSLAPYGGNPF
ncbi:MAG: hypothetical protein J5685_07405 [Clostridiales bacterium]|nr:hypothetical protein [Clostridiales bacterium]